MQSNNVFCEFSSASFHRKYLFFANLIDPSRYICVCERGTREAVCGKRLLSELLGRRSLSLYDHGDSCFDLLPSLSSLCSTSLVVDADWNQSVGEAKLLAPQD